jgi:shikimate dehydrogenase
MVYQPLETTLLKAARAAGARAVDGLWMLVHQAAEQLRLWTGAEVPPAAVASLHDALVRGPR